MAAGDGGAHAAMADDLPAPPKRPFALCPGVVVDPAADCLYMMNPQGGIDAVALASGRLLWSTPQSGKPLAVADNRLASQGEPAHGAVSLPILFLNARQGRIESRAGLPMPAGVMPPNIDDRLTTSSTVEARFETDGLLIAWRVIERQMSGLPRPMMVREHAGGALIDLQTNRVTTLDAAQAEARMRAATPPAPPRLAGSEGVYFAPQRVGEFLVSVKLGPASAGQPATLKRWSAADGAPLPDIELGSGYVDSAVSADRSLFLVVSRASTSGASDRWSIYAVDTGRRVAELRLGNAARPFFVWHSILIYEASPESRPAGKGSVEEPLRLRGLDLKTGAELWKRALRNTSYTGSYPPHP